MFSRFDTIPACDGQTDGRTDGQTDVQPIAKTCFSIADARKNRNDIVTSRALYIGVENVTGNSA